ncbi:MAG TPA: DUF2934 domain-containing protein [Methylophilus sp.]|uniref:DUF2934 domain-containing protein n=1 Tax=Methylophilus sp. TaxID=29541 RepID=UPI002C203217|nr:DUF2934 domain-containing protein [Methylophilus sp.]HSH87741.1 DUF2934 domain-containing protein [Methylophilus sp.]
MATSKTTDNGSKKSTVKKAATPKAAAPKPVAKKAATKATDATKKNSTKKTSASKIVTSATRLQMIEETAYYIAEKNGFYGESIEYWLAAEKEVDSKLNA